jgi:hypothetical protein
LGLSWRLSLLLSSICFRFPLTMVSMSITRSLRCGSLCHACLWSLDSFSWSWLEVLHGIYLIWTWASSIENLLSCFTQVNFLLFFIALAILWYISCGIVHASWLD